jgi:hypothetical protein
MEWLKSLPYRLIRGSWLIVWTLAGIVIPRTVAGSRFIGKITRFAFIWVVTITISVVGIRTGILPNPGITVPGIIQAPPNNGSPSGLIQLTADSPSNQVAQAGQQLLDKGLITIDRYECKDPQTGQGSVRGDLTSGNLYYKVILWFQVVAQEGHFRLQVNCVQSGHSKDRLLHQYWKAADINGVAEADGSHFERVDSHGPEIMKLGQWIRDRLNKDPTLVPYEVGGPYDAVMRDPTGKGGVHDRQKHFGNARRGPYFYGLNDQSPNGNHEDHFHFGQECTPGQFASASGHFCSNGGESRGGIAASYNAAKWL